MEISHTSIIFNVEIFTPISVNLDMLHSDANPIEWILLSYRQFINIETISAISDSFILIMSNYLVYSSEYLADGNIVLFYRKRMTKPTSTWAVLPTCLTAHWPHQYHKWDWLCCWMPSQQKSSNSGLPSSLRVTVPLLRISWYRSWKLYVTPWRLWNLTTLHRLYRYGKPN